jgi:protein-tyrosine kinase
MERAAAQTVDVSALPPKATAEAEPPEAISAAAKSNDLTTAGAVFVPGDVLRFDDFRARCAHPAWTATPDLNVFNPAYSPHGAEQFRTLRSRLYQLRSIRRLHTVLVTSSVSAEGKTFVASNLAQAIVRQHDRRVLLIDGDLRSSRLHARMGAPSTPGLSDYLRGDADEWAVIQQGPQEKLCLIPGGNLTSNPSELLSNGRLKILLDRVAALFDWVIIDSPPCLPVADANVLADFCDGLLLVVRAGSTAAATVQRARQELQGRNVVGVVLNAVTTDGLTYGSYYGSPTETQAAKG